MHLFGATPDVLDYALTYTGITSFRVPVCHTGDRRERPDTL